MSNRVVTAFRNLLYVTLLSDSHRWAFGCLAIGIVLGFWEPIPRSQASDLQILAQQDSVSPTSPGNFRIKKFPVDGGALSVTWSPDGRLLATSSAAFAHITIWDTETGKSLRQLNRGAAFGASLAFTPDGKFLLTPMAVQGGDAQRNTVSIWDVNSGTIASQILGPYETPGSGSNLAEAFALCPAGKFLAVMTRGRPPGVVGIYDTSNWTLIKTLSPGSAVMSVAASPDGKWLALGTVRGAIAIYDTASWSLTRTIDAYAGFSAQVASLKFSPDSNLLVSGPSAAGRPLPNGTVEAVADSIRIWRVSSGEKEMALPLALGGRLTGTVRDIAWSPDSHHIATSSDRSIRLWDLDQPRSAVVVTTFPKMAWGVAFSPDGNWLAATGDGAVEVVEVKH